MISTRDGATTNTRRSENGGTQSSLKRILNVSAEDLQQAGRPDAVGAVAVLDELRSRRSYQISPAAMVNAPISTSRTVSSAQYHAGGAGGGAQHPGAARDP